MWRLGREISDRVQARPYTYADADWPDYLPITLSKTKWKFNSNTTHYGISSEEDEHDWASIFPDGNGFVRLGPNKRLFALSVYHEMHCMQSIRRAILQEGYGSGHVQHCLNYLRQMILCRADVQLEPVMEDGSVAWGRERTCRNREELYSWLSKNMAEYRLWRWDQ
ncbi:hypothetical protein NEOLEDRAFT_1139244 [Neolentinus lepideus HHB14362 ss-1]|uniref:Oxidase ustYa n=1 Tax=Neolentinus lepideus HHB14362 ss-1 TaxID=1314782 RepID=A0A165PXH6_9AGAM|nr:hypothetical protein NEOLEDRAFT_1139244 [Neolentinus lepideus HHB14362 ss-1]